LTSGDENFNDFPENQLTKMLAKMRPDRLKMHQKAFGGRAPPGPAGGA